MGAGQNRKGEIMSKFKYIVFNRDTGKTVRRFVKWEAALAFSRTKQVYSNPEDI